MADVLSITCKSCGAGPGVECRSGTGKVRAVPHAPRAVAAETERRVALAYGAAREPTCNAVGDLGQLVVSAACPLCPAHAGTTHCFRPVGSRGVRWAALAEGVFHNARRVVASNAKARDAAERLLQEERDRAHAEALEHVANGDAGDEWTSDPVAREGMAAFLHLVRGKDDPAESRRGGGSERRALWGVAPHTKLSATDEAAWVGPIRALLAEQPGLTFNALAVTLTGLTADVAHDSPLDTALWSLSAAGEVEHTLAVPIRWRLTGRAAPAVPADQLTLFA